MISESDQDLIRAYRVFFNSPEGLAVAKDLMKYCKFRTAIAGEIDEGKRQVFLRILEMSQLSDEQLLQLYAGRLMIVQQPEPQDD